MTQNNEIMSEIRFHLFKIDKRFKRNRKLFTVILYAWLFMNTDPIYPQRVLRSMVASRLSRSFVRPFIDINNSGGGGSNGHNGLNAAEAIAMIHAMNGNRGSGASGGGGQREDLTTALITNRNHRPLNSRQLSVLPPSQGIDTRQAESAPIAVVLAALAALLAAAIAGLTPAAALLAAALAALAALWAILAALVPNRSSPIIKKLVIKKTVLPFVIPIPFKKKEKEIVYVPKPVHHYHKEHVHIVHKKKYKKSDDSFNDELQDKRDLNQVDKIRTVLSEQERIQNLLEEAIEANKVTPALMKRGGTLVTGEKAVNRS